MILLVPLRGCCIDFQLKFNQDRGCVALSTDFSSIGKLEFSHHSLCHVYIKDTDARFVCVLVHWQVKYISESLKYVSLHA